MKREEIYDHLAQVYLGKSKKVDVKKNRQFSVWLFINILITLIIFTSAFYGFSAFLTDSRPYLKSKVVFPLHNGAISLSYNFDKNVQPEKIFNLTVPPLNTEKYNTLRFSVRGKEEGNPGVLKVVVTNRKSETASYYVRGIDAKWAEFIVPFDEFKQITDWTNIEDVSFVLEAWNVEKKRGLILIEGVSFCYIN